jgi:regulator of sigma E protease
MSAVGTSLAAVGLIAALIIIHELGHFLAAKALGVRVNVFSVGVGGRLFGFRWGDTDYRVSWFPFGGYVRMAGADPFMEGGADADEDDVGRVGFMSRPAWQRLIIVAAGPVMNLILPFVVFTALKVAGDPQARAEVGRIYPGSVAEAAGVLPEDLVQSVEGARVRTWLDVVEAFQASTDDTLDLVVDRQGAQRLVALPVGDLASREPSAFGLLHGAPEPRLVVDAPASPAGRAGLRTGDTVLSVDGVAVRTWNEVQRLALARAGRALELEVIAVATKADPAPAARKVRLEPDAAWPSGAVEADDELWRVWGLASARVAVGPFGKTSAAKEAGVKEGDRIVAIDGKPVRSWDEIPRAVNDASSGEGKEQVARALMLSVRRGGEIHEIKVQPAVQRVTDALGRYRWRALLGITGGATVVDAPLVPRPYPFAEALVRASVETTGLANFMVEQIGKIATGDAPADENLGGPVAMFVETRAAAERGIYDWVRQLGLFSLSLGIINLLPIPVLDGGQLLMYSAEWIRGRPLPVVLRERALQAGVIFLVLLMLFVFANDIRRLFETTT